ncbi:MAG: peptide deformylase [Candidatus Dormibacteraceae bacterium]
MSVRKILTSEVPVLRQMARKVPRVDETMIKLLDDLTETMYEAHGAGLAAPQIGVPLRACVVKGEQGQPVALVNPEIVKAEGSQVGYEGCLSIPGMVGEVERAESVVVKAMGRRGKPIRVRASGFTARAYQHEIDHLDGVLFTDKLTSLATLHHVDEAVEGEAPEPEPAGSDAEPARARRELANKG